MIKKNKEQFVYKDIHCDFLLTSLLLHDNLQKGYLAYSRNLLKAQHLMQV